MLHNTIALNVKCFFYKHLNYYIERQILLTFDYSIRKDNNSNSNSYLVIIKLDVCLKQQI